LDNLRTQIGYHYYWDKPAKYGKVDYATGNFVTNGETCTLPDGTQGAYLKHNSYEIGASLEYDVAKSISLSGGYLYASTTPTLAYQTDLSYTLSSQTFGFGAVGHVNENFNIDLGFSYTIYQNGDKTINYPSTGTTNVKETYDKKTTIFALGLSYRFGK
jgi:long-subunit fatty acid transport protein